MTAQETVDTTPRLPNECLALIIRHYTSDIKSLHSFLFVNRFFFHTALPLLMHDVFLTWHLNFRDGRDRDDKEKLMALVVGSVVHHNQRLTVDALDPQDILTKFGLELVLPATMDLISRCLDPGVKMTTDYSKHFMTLSSYLWDETDYDGFLHLKDNADNLSIGPEEIAHPASTVTLGGPRPDSIVDRIANLLLYYNYECVTEICIHINQTPQYLPLADKMVRLKTIRLERDIKLPHEDLTVFLDFLRIHHTAFPYKRRLTINFEFGWIIRRPSNSPEDRQWSKTFQQDIVTIYKGLDKIYALDSTHFIDFYTLWEDTDLYHLEMLGDCDCNRWQHGEKQEDQAAFFKRCHNLRSLTMATTTPDTFSWAVDHLAGMRSQYLPELQDIELCYDGAASDAIRILCDVTTAFAPSLRTVTVECECGYDRTSKSPADYAGKIMDHWNLPWMTHLNIDVPKMHGLRIGSLDQCSMLKSLVMRFGVGKPSQELETDIAVDLFPKWTLPRLTELMLDYTPALLFNYDSLETMSSLRNIRFHAHEDSEYMPFVHRIRRLSAHVTPLQNPTSVGAHGPLLGHPKNMLAANGEGKARLGLGDRWLGGWRLPLLESLLLRGPPSFVFCFDWLKGCPRLNQLNLHCSDIPQRLPLSWSAPCALNLLPMTEPTNTPRVDVHNPSRPQLYQPLGPFSGNMGDPPMLDHQLASLRMHGLWIMSEQDFVRVLTHYAPNLQNLDISGIHELIDAHRKGHQFVHLVLEADRILHELGIGEGGSNDEKVEAQKKEPLPDHVNYSSRRTKLTMVKTDYSIQHDQVNHLGMTMIVGKDLAEKYSSAGLRVYKFGSTYFVNTVDYSL